MKTNKKLVCGIGITDITTKNGNEDAYTKWKNMLGRCYSEKIQKTQPMYKGCSVCNDWLVFSKFKEWYDVNYRVDQHIDKDILIKGNKIYSPNTCRFVPHNINNLLLDHRSDRGIQSLGVTKHGNRYKAQCSVNCRRVRIGSFSTETEAFGAYKHFKEATIKSISQTAYNQTLIDLDIYTALQNWIIYP